MSNSATLPAPLVVLSELTARDDFVEVVERKGLGHPDTICDALAENFSRNLCREYSRRFGHILHHNVDKALVSGGRSAPSFGGGSMIAPINIYLAGRATMRIGDERIPVEDIAIEGSRSWLRANLHALEPEQDVRLHVLTQPGSQDLQELFSRASQVPLANDTSIGVGYAPLSALEQLVLAAERRINGRDRARASPAWGEDVKVMGIRRGGSVRLTVACAMIGRHIANIEDYFAEKLTLQKLVEELAEQHGFADRTIDVNIADGSSPSAVYLTVTGTSAEAGDDGQVGRGNRVNGLITPGRPMSLEAAAGKNPVSHVGKIYNALARDVAAAIVAETPEVVAAECLLVSRIGAPITQPAVVEVKVATRDGKPLAEIRRRVEDITADCLNRIPALVEGFVTGETPAF
ncbi:methionine adenosyltransferase [Mesorhizobium sp. M4B.F.Ca.ET.049.02.1.2]|uniref:methionine adenosyltransferase n=1 Tax=Mesorhizobium sp. M4B.F.Ca.ET.049.02.1.2 TaxID=2496752 RepID=UPI000FCADC6D|nr:methionine adenosyltransferase [Mesorhizobium sp. M4B.F.Ca.ET.049.02.1.2]RUW76605.1 methionine adenosyltransferase [Mesorhizobium sp. M4B.F.Ca.ET.049.02.1.2]